MNNTYLVKNKAPISPREYVEMITGQYYITIEQDTISGTINAIMSALRENNIKNEIYFRFEQIKEVLRNGNPVVAVTINAEDTLTGEWTDETYWFTVNNLYPKRDKENVCPVCGNKSFEYGDARIEDEGVSYPWECNDCHATGRESFSRVFDEHYNVQTADGKEFISDDSPSAEN